MHMDFELSSIHLNIQQFGFGKSCIWIVNCVMLHFPADLCVFAQCLINPYAAGG